ncbi:hypothetical protein TNIN_97101 [Trichonephila inaurata madagascariensis]|uniref:Uncharacterized protein n=1 Tax=Trichonephila inaurata madagascariensis TaxID=2747483 RepID=A0A8X7C9S6_9ARAC|nr:hypothetical protein TNIN_97101 [Trichonephila inaurata madagascariensis]
MTAGGEVHPTNMGLEGGGPTTVPPLPPYTCMTIIFTYIILSSPQKHLKSLSMANLHDFLFLVHYHTAQNRHMETLWLGKARGRVWGGTKPVKNLPNVR